MDISRDEWCDNYVVLQNKNIYSCFEADKYRFKPIDYAL